MNLLLFVSYIYIKIGKWISYWWPSVSGQCFLGCDFNIFVQAIALSLQDPSDNLSVVDHSPSKSSYTRAKDCDVDKLKDTSPVKEDIGRRKRKKLVRFCLVW